MIKILCEKNLHHAPPPVGGEHILQQGRGTDAVKGLYKTLEDLVWLTQLGLNLLLPLGLADVGLYPGYFAGAGCRGAKFLGVRQRASQAGPERQTPPRRVQLAPVNYNTGRAFP